MTELQIKKPYIRHFRLRESDKPLLEKLTDNEQIILRQGGGKIRSIAGYLDLPIGTVKSRMHRARTKLIAMRASETEKMINGK